MEPHLNRNCVDNIGLGFAGSCDAAEFFTIEDEWIFWLSVATAAAFVALAIPRVLYLFRHPSLVRAPIIVLAVKLVAGTLFVGLRLGLVVVAIRQTNTRTTRLVASNGLDLAASCLLLALSPLEHFKSQRPSILACSYLLLALIHDLARCPSLWSDGDYAAFTGMFTTAIIVEFVFLVLECARRRRWVVWNAEDHSPEETSSILSLGLYSWLNPLLWRGYHEPLAMRHLYALDRSISIETLHARNQSGSLEGSIETSIWHLFLWLAKPLRRSSLLPIFPRLCLLGFTFCQPFLPAAPTSLPLSTLKQLVHCIRTRCCRCLHLFRHCNLDWAVLVLSGALPVTAARFLDISYLPQDE